MMNPEEPQVSSTGRYTVSQTCKILGIHRNTLRRHTLQHKIKVRLSRINGRPFYRGSDIISYFKSER